MEREIVELRNQLANQQGLTSPSAQTHPSQGHFGLTPAPLGQAVPHISPSPLDQYMGSQDAVAGLLDLKSGGENRFGKSPGPDGRPLKRLEGVVLTSSQTDELFRMYDPQNDLAWLDCSQVTASSRSTILYSHFSNRIDLEITTLKDARYYSGLS
jgi:hypothetical protein